MECVHRRILSAKAVNQTIIIMNVQSLNKEKAYQVTRNGVKGVLTYFYVYVNAWCFAPADKRHFGPAYQPVPEEELANLKAKAL